MKLITDPYSLRLTFNRLFKEHDEFHWAVAWGGNPLPAVIQNFLKNKSKICKIAIGLHFYQTHPAFIAHFINDNRVRFIQQTNGTFHPKVYLFYTNPDKWEIIIGSSNFTYDAFYNNLEACTLISNTDKEAIDFLRKTQRFISNSWKTAKVFTQKDLEDYTTIWKYQRTKIESLSGQYGSSNKKAKPIHLIPIVTRSWDNFISAVEGEINNGFINRIKVIKIAQELFNSVNHFNELDAEQRKFIAGISNKLEIQGAEHWAYFGSMEGAGVFKNKVINNNKYISKALDQIPLKGPVTSFQFDSFILNYEKAFKNTRLENANKIATATRLLSMKRPDTFICFDNKNSKSLCKDFNISKYMMTYQRYWDEIVLRIQDCEWWLNPEPQNEAQRSVSEARAAFLDSIYYHP